MTRPITPFEADTLLSEAYSYHTRALSYSSEYKRLSEKRGDFMADEYMKKAAEYAGEAMMLSTEIIRPLEDEYKARRWSRFFLVTSSVGHVHSSMNCHTCLPTTQYAWLPDLSGKTEDEAVKQYGEKMCTECFPSAPAHPAYIKSKAEREAAEAAKLAGQCPGSGDPPKVVKQIIENSRGKFERAYYQCSYEPCVASISMTRNFLVRSHKLITKETYTVKFYRYADVKKTSVELVKSVDTTATFDTVKRRLWDLSHKDNGQAENYNPGGVGAAWSSGDPAWTVIQLGDNVVYEKGGWVKRRVKFGG